MRRVLFICLSVSLSFKADLLKTRKKPTKKVGKIAKNGLTKGVR